MSGEEESLLYYPRPQNITLSVFRTRSCDQCRRHGFLRDLSGKEYTCGACLGAGVVRG